MRIDQRKTDEIRKILITRNYTENPAGSVLITAGKTRVLCTASISDQIPPWLKGSGSGWVTAEYAMLPGSTTTRKSRSDRTGKVDGRAQEIQRLIGRSLRAATDLSLLPDRAVWLDCDVIQADGGTRTLAISGAWVALHDAFLKMKESGELKGWPLRTQVAALSVGIVAGEALLDLCYQEDAQADVDMNIVMTGEGDFIEVQGTAEKGTFSGSQLEDLLALAKKGVNQILTKQREAIQS